LRHYIVTLHVAFLVTLVVYCDTACHRWSIAILHVTLQYCTSHCNDHVTLQYCMSQVVHCDIACDIPCEIRDVV